MLASSVLSILGPSEASWSSAGNAAWVCGTCSRRVPGWYGLGVGCTLHPVTVDLLFACIWRRRQANRGALHMAGQAGPLGLMP